MQSRVSQDISREGGKLGELGSEKKREVHSNNMMSTAQKKHTQARVASSTPVLSMTRVGTFTMISRVVVVRHLEGLHCAVGPIVSHFNLSSLRPKDS